MIKDVLGVYNCKDYCARRVKDNKEKLYLTGGLRMEVADF
jgi:hypothetical protein